MSDQTKPQGVGVFEWIAAFRATDKDATGDDGKRLLTPSVVAVAFVLASHATYKTGKNVRPGTTLVAHGAGVDRSTVGVATGRLIKLGWVEVTARQPGRPVVYRLTLPVSPVPVTAGSGSLSAGGGVLLTPLDMSTTSVLTSSTRYTPTAIEIRSRSKPVEPWNEGHTEQSHRKATTNTGSRRVRDGY